MHALHGPLFGAFDDPKGLQGCIKSKKLHKSKKLCFCVIFKFCLMQHRIFEANLEAHFSGMLTSQLGLQAVVWCGVVWSNKVWWVVVSCGEVWWGVLGWCGAREGMHFSQWKNALLLNFKMDWMNIFLQICFKIDNTLRADTSLISTFCTNRAKMKIKN